MTAICWPSTGFELPTHAAITSAGVAQSKLTSMPSNSALLSSLGLVDHPNLPGSPYPPLGERYIDIGPSLVTRFGLGIERAVVTALRRPATGLTIPEEFSIPGWILRGAIREDDNTRDTPSPPAGDGDEPGGTFNRNFGHFFDPHHDRGLTMPIVGNIGPRAVDWALSSEAAIGTRKNHFKVSDAREAMWRALTLTRVDEGGNLSADVTPSDWDSASREALRKAYWATTFRALGDATHLLQDMAQPQHTRNDAHAGLGCVPGVGCAAGHASFVENYFEARTTRAGSFALKEGFLNQNPRPDAILTTAAQLPYDGYPVPRFTTYAEYFATATAQGKGLANYSNRGFYSFGTNINSSLTPYPSPSPTGSDLGIATVSEPDLKGMTGESLQGTVTFRVGTVTDTVTGVPATGVKLSTVGAWDQFLKQTDPEASSYTLNYYNYDAQADLLVPRAVAYSAGLIDHFFRGKLKISLPDDRLYGIVDHTTFDVGDPATGFTKLKLKVENETPAIGSEAQDMVGGKIVAVVKFRRNGNYTSILSGECGSPGQGLAACRGEQEEILVSSSVKTPDGVPVTSVTLMSGAQAQELHFAFDEALPLNVTDLYLQVVYRGPLGSEADAVVVETKDIPEPTYLTILNATNSVICVDGAWEGLHVDGSVPAQLVSPIQAHTGGPLPAPLTSRRVGVSFKAPFTYPLTHPETPPYERRAFVDKEYLAPGQFIRMAVLTDDATPFAFDAVYFDFYGERPLNTASNGVIYPAGVPLSQVQPMQPFRGTYHGSLRFAYRSYGAPCTTNEWPNGTEAPWGGTYPVPVLAPIDALAF